MNAVFTSSAPATFSNATSPTITITAGLTSTTISSVTSSLGFVSANNYQYVYGNTTTLTAKVTPSTGSPASPAFAAANTVQFYDNGTTLLGSAQPSNAGGAGNGVATLIRVVLGGGVHNITAQFVGNAVSGASDPNYAASGTSITSQVTVTPALPTLSVGGAPFTVTFGGGLTTGAITLAGVTQVASNYAAPTGAVTVKSGATSVGSASTLLPPAPPATTARRTDAGSGSASLGVASGLNLTFTSAADANYQAATFTTTITISKTTTAVTITSPTVASLAPGSPVYGQPVTLVATFTTISGAPLANGDTVAFTDGVSNLTGCTSQPVTTTSGVSSATCILPATTGSTPTLGVGGHSIGVTGLSADPDYTMGGVTTLGFSVAKAPSVTLLTSSTNPSVPGQTVTFSSTSTVPAPGGEAPLNTAQTVTFYNAGAPISAACTNVAVNAAGQASCTIPTNTCRSPRPATTTSRRSSAVMAMWRPARPPCWSSPWATRAGDYGNVQQSEHCLRRAGDLHLYGDWNQQRHADRPDSVLRWHHHPGNCPTGCHQPGRHRQRLYHHPDRQR